jgi:mRNA interferase MazF
MDEYKKNHDEWNDLKKSLDADTTDHLFREREIWWCALGVNIGSEQDGKNKKFERPVLILRKISKDQLWILPLTSKIVENEYRIITKSTGEMSQVVLSQIRTISSKRLLRRIGRIKNELFNKAIVKLVLFLLETIQNETPP